MNQGNTNPNAIPMCLTEATKGKIQVGDQEYSHLKTHINPVLRTDCKNEVYMISFTQNPQKHQKYVTWVLGLPESKVICIIEQVGIVFSGFWGWQVTMPTSFLNLWVWGWDDWWALKQFFLKPLNPLLNHDVSCITLSCAAALARGESSPAVAVLLAVLEIQKWDLLCMATLV